MNPSSLGYVLRNLRVRKGWTLKEMSVRTGVPLSTLGKVESGCRTLTYDKLLHISECLQVRMSDFFTRDSPDSGKGRYSVARVDRTLHVRTRNYAHQFLCTELRSKRMLPVLTRVLARSVGEFGELVHHSGEEFVYVIDGQVEVHTEFYSPVVLGAGESIYLDSNMGHAFVVAPGCAEASVLAVCSSSDEGLLQSFMK